MLIETVILASVASLLPLAGLAGTSPTVASAAVASAAVASATVGSAARVAPAWASYLLAVQAPWRTLQLTPPCVRSRRALPAPCRGSMSGPDIDQALPAPIDPDVGLPSRRDELGASLGGFVNIDVMQAPHLTAGPELSWLTPESPREDLMRLRILASGWGIRYTWSETGISAGVAVCTRFVKMGEIDLPVVDMLTSEARIEFLLP